MTEGTTLQFRGYVLLLMFTTLFFLSGIPAIHLLEYLEKTEADRTLIAWEMFQRGEYLVPYLLGDLYVTKPPAYYALLAKVFEYVGTPSIPAARWLSLLAGTLVLFVQYSFLRALEWRVHKAVLSVFILATSFEFLVYSQRAEIDMLYTLGCSVTLFLFYLLFQKDKFHLLVFLTSYLALGITFFVKGPPVLLFVGAGFVAMLLYRAITGKKLVLLSWIRFQLTVNALGVSCLLIVILLWLQVLTAHTTLGDVWLRFDEEWFGRFRENTSRNLGRGFWYYCFGFLGSTFPWSVFALWVVGVNARDVLKVRFPSAEQVRRTMIQRELYFYLFGVVLLSFVVFCFAESKANRYLLPLLPPCSVLLAEFFWSVGRKRQETGMGVFVLRELGRMGIILSTPLFFCVLYYQSFWIALLVLSGTLAPFSLLYLSARMGEANSFRILFFLSLCALSLRLPYAYAYAPYRNSQLSVREIAYHIDSHVPPGEELYVLEMWQKWTLYYLVLEGQEVKRLTPALALDRSRQAGRVFLLFTDQDELWRLRQIEDLDPEYRVVYEASTTKHHYFLVQMKASVLPNLEPKRVFPVQPSEVPEQYRNDG